MWIKGIHSIRTVPVNNERDKDHDSDPGIDTIKGNWIVGELPSHELVKSEEVPPLDT